MRVGDTLRNYGRAQHDIGHKRSNDTRNGTFYVLSQAPCDTRSHPGPSRGAKLIEESDRQRSNQRENASQTAPWIRVAMEPAGDMPSDFASYLPVELSLRIFLTVARLSLPSL